MARKRPDHLRLVSKQDGGQDARLSPTSRFLIQLVVMLVLEAGLFALLWNALLPGFVPLGRIGFWQAMGLLILIRLPMLRIEHYEAETPEPDPEEPDGGGSLE